MELLLQLVLLLSHLLGELLEELPRSLLLPEDSIGVAFHGVVLPSRLAFFSPFTGPVFQYRRRLFLVIRPGKVSRQNRWVVSLVLKNNSSRQGWDSINLGESGWEMDALRRGRKIRKCVGFRL